MRNYSDSPKHGNLQFLSIMNPIFDMERVCKPCEMTNLGGKGM